MEKTKGLTLIEAMLSIVIIAIIAGSAAPISSYFQNKNEVDSERNVIVKSLRRAQALSQDMSLDSTWGVKIILGQIVLFRGNNYSSRITSSDEVFNFPISVIPTGIDEIVFSKIWGEPNNFGTITLTGPNNEIDEIIINSKGMVDY